MTNSFTTLPDSHCMVQRIQSVYLLIAAVLSAVYFIQPFSSKILPKGEVATADGNIVYVLNAMEVLKSEDGISASVSSNHYLASLCFLSGLTALFAMLKFNNRKLQIKICWLASIIFLSILVTAYFLSDRMGAESDQNKNPVYLISSYIPFLQFVMIRLAIVNIKKDEALIKSADRIR